MSNPEPVRAPARARGKADVFQAVADPTRRSMLALLTDKEMAVAELTRQLPVSRTAVNKHLQVLLEAGLVNRRRAGRETRYRFRPEPLEELKRWLAFFDRYWDERLSSLKRFVEAEEDAGIVEPGGDSAAAAAKEDGEEAGRRIGGSRAGEWQAWMD